MKKICVLMSTYNGEKYLEEQLDSIINQQNIKIDVLIRDDGSTDDTLKILEKYSKSYKNITYYTGKNLRSAQSFMDLIYSCGEYEYYAFADQDDVWDLDKLETGIKYLNKDYHLYGCKKRIVDKNLKFLNQEDEEPVDLTLGSVLLRCNIAGCTMIFDNFLREKILEYKPQKISMHDSWILKVAVCVGKVYFDIQTHMFYRQHEKNVVGAKDKKIIIWKNRIKNFKKRKEDTMRIDMAKELYKKYSKYLDESLKEDLYYFAYSRESYKNRVKVILKKFIYGKNIFETLMLKILILIGII